MQTLCRQLIRCPPCVSRASFLIWHILARINEGTSCLSICSVCSRHRPWRKHRLEQSAPLPLAFIFPYLLRTSMLCHKRIHSLQSSAHNWDLFKPWHWKSIYQTTVEEAGNEWCIFSPSPCQRLPMAWNPQRTYSVYVDTFLSFQFRISPTDNFRWQDRVHTVATVLLLSGEYTNSLSPVQVFTCRNIPVICTVNKMTAFNQKLILLTWSEL